MAEAKNPDFRKFTASHVRRTLLEYPSYDPEGHFTAMDKGRMIGSGLAMYDPNRAAIKGPEGYFDLFILPEYLGQDIERELFARVVENIRQRGGEWITTRVDTRYVERVSLLKRLGFSKTEYQNHGMEKDPRSIEEPRAPEGYRIQVASLPEELETMHRVLNDSFATRDKWAPKSFEVFQKSWIFDESEDRSGIFLASRDSDEEVVGMVFSAINRRYNEEHGVRRGGTYALAVIPSERKKGLGTCLTLKSIKWIGEKGMDVAYVSVNAANKDALKIYQSLGYQTVQVYQGYRKTII